MEHQYKYKIIEIIDKPHLAKLIKRFDSKHGTTTSFFTTNFPQLNEMLHMFFPNKKGKLSAVINLSWVVKRAFKGRDLITAADINVNDFEQVDSVHKLNAIYTMLQEIKKGNRFSYPLILTLLPNNQYVIDPGNTRMLFNHVYNKDVDIMFVRYPNTKNDLNMSNVSLYSTKNFKFNTLRDLRYQSCITGDEGAPGFIAQNFSGIPWHWVQHSSIEYGRDQAISKSNNRVFELKDNKYVTCNGDVFIERDSVYGFTVTL